MSGFDLTATSYLGDNTIPILGGLIDSVNRHPAMVGLRARLRFDPDRTATDRRAGIDAGRFDLVWVCGLYTVCHLVPAGHYRVVAVPAFAGEPEPVYRSVIVARPDTGLWSLEGAAADRARLVANEAESWSGYHGLTAELARRGLSTAFTDEPIFSGSHARSVAMVAASDPARPTVAAIDHTVWHALLAAGDPAAAELVVIDRTADWPSPPFSVRAALDDQPATALTTALLAARGPGLGTVVPATADRYRAMVDRTG